MQNRWVIFLFFFFELVLYLWLCICRSNNNLKTLVVKFVSWICVLPILQKLPRFLAIYIFTRYITTHGKWIARCFFFSFFSSFWYLTFSHFSSQNLYSALKDFTEAYETTEQGMDWLKKPLGNIVPKIETNKRGYKVLPVHIHFSAFFLLFFPFLFFCYRQIKNGKKRNSNKNANITCHHPSQCCSRTCEQCI